MRRAALVVLFHSVIAISIASPAQIFATVYNFCSQNNCPDGAAPNALVQGSDGNFYGTTQGGGTQHQGTVFKITPQGTLTTLHSFCSEPYCADGQAPFARLVQANDGNFYGTTLEGGEFSIGTVFRITPEGTLTTLHSFQDEDGAAPGSALIQGVDGYLYGTTSSGGAHNQGTVIRITLDGTVSVLYSFCALTRCADGRLPQASLVQATDGNFYGTTTGGGAYCWDSGGCGTVFQITPQGTLTTLYSFCPQAGCADGDWPDSVLLQASDGNLYGTTNIGGANNFGSVFKITTQGMLSSLHSFTHLDGLNPYAGLAQGSDGNLYGATYQGGAYCFAMGGCGTVFKITPSGTLTTLHSFDNSDGSLIFAGLVRVTDGSFYGTALNGGANNAGTVFHLIAYATLSVSKTGMGTVSGVDGQIYCGTMCSYTFDIGTQVTLSAVPSPGSTFTGWTGCDQTNGSYCSVAMTGAKNVTAAFDTANVTLTSLTFKPTYVKGGQLSAGTLTLSGAAPPGGLTVALSSDHPGVAHPPSFVFIPGGKSSVGFAVQTFPVKSNTTVMITATAGSSQVSGTLMVGTTSLPPSLR
jgi:uncharacterized repeat protein (TIGR03803 family)